MTAPLTVEFFGYLPGLGKGNLLWPKPFHPRRGGKFPRSHPCSTNPRPTVTWREDQPASDDPLGRFRARGYLASCFPEGDGICFEPPEGRASDDQVRDVEECFGWRVVVKRP